MSRSTQLDSIFLAGTCVDTLCEGILVCDSFANPMTHAAFLMKNHPDTKKNFLFSRYLWSRFRDFAHKWLLLYSFRKKQMLTKFHRTATTQEKPWPPRGGQVEGAGLSYPPLAGGKGKQGCGAHTSWCLTLFS